jgi:hypothetical protein
MCVSNGSQVSRIAGQVMKRTKSIDFTDYWQAAPHELIG